jgi:hypothetical protein
MNLKLRLSRQDAKSAKKVQGKNLGGLGVLAAKVFMSHAFA